MILRTSVPRVVTLGSGVVVALSVSCAQLLQPAPPSDLSRAEVAASLERISAAVPWPRGIQVVGKRAYVLSRGVHRSAGGPQADIDDRAGSLFVVDPTIAEAARRDQPVGDAVRNNAVLLAAPTSPPFRVWDRRMPATEDTRTDRPYCMLVYDAPSQNFFICGYSGIDLPHAPKFRKNASDSVHRYDLRLGQWRSVEAHDPDSVPVAALQSDVDSRYYPHHDPSKNPPPHGFVNGPCGAVVAGRFLYVGGKDNTTLAQYDLAEIRRDPNAAAPPSRLILDGTRGSAFVSVRGHGRMELGGTCALAVDRDHLYVAFRTTSQIIRLKLDRDGDVVQPVEAEYIAQFARYDPVRRGGSANIYDMAFDSKGRLYVSPGYDGAIYRFTPDHRRVYDTTERAYEPFVDLDALVGAKKSGNICFDDEDRLYICSGQKVLEGTPIRGVVYRVRTVSVRD